MQINVYGFVCFRFRCVGLKSTKMKLRDKRTDENRKGMFESALVHFTFTKQFIMKIAKYNYVFNAFVIILFILDTAKMISVFIPLYFSLFLCKTTTTTYYEWYLAYDD